ncbi:MAG: phosphoribosylformylglycinamidine synthase subunit PurQ [Bacteroidota bacterium]|nr:phosphoribosylformylglycinamidine synthase subunit PurQ [Bacteroidota bacterium]
MKFGVVVFPGSNCDHDLLYAMNDIMGHEAVKLWHKDTDLQGCDFIFLPGGFSYGDYLRSGAIARFSPIMNSVIDHANKGGYLMGICNGFQILTEAGLLPGALLRNAGRLFISDNQYITPVSDKTIVTKGIPKGKALKIPIAHGDGRFYCDNDTLKQLEDNHQVIFKYCDANGEINDTSNPNGSLNNIAGICNSKRNVFGMMPHPERAVDMDLGNTDGKYIFESILEMVTT